jgi:ribosome-binding factor A
MARPNQGNEDRSVRLLKVGERVRHVLSELLMRQEVHDDTLSAHHISITEVRMSADLRQARVYAKPLLGGDEAEVLAALKRNTAYLQREVAQRLGLKFAPRLKFLADESFDEAERIERLLNDPKVARDLGELGED